MIIIFSILGYFVLGFATALLAWHLNIADDRNPETATVTIFIWPIYVVFLLFYGIGKMSLGRLVEKTYNYLTKSPS